MILPWINTGAFVIMILINALANLLPIGGNTTGQVSMIYANLFTPAPITFSIWGLIYLFMLAFVLYQHGLLGGNTNGQEIRSAIGPWFMISCILNITWLFFWHFQWIGCSSICIALLLVVLAMILQRLRGVDTSPLMPSIIRVGFSLYFGWIIAATIANLCVFLTKIGWYGRGISEDLWTVIFLLIGALIAAAIAQPGKNRIAAVSVLWAYAGILLRHLTLEEMPHPFIITAGLISEAIILASILMPQEPLRHTKDAAS